MNIDFLNELLASHGVSGDESDINNVFSDYLKPYCELSIDSINNCYAKINSGNTTRVLIDAHIDEIGFQVSYIDESGFIYLRKTGGIDAASLVGSQVVIKSRRGEEIIGVIGKRPMHIEKPDETMRVPEIEDLWVDTGLDSQIVLQNVVIGDFVSFRSNLVKLSEHRIASKGIDNRVGVFVLSQIMKRLSEKNLTIGIFGVASAQEEVGAKGAKVSCSNVKPQIALCVDMGFATDVPNVSKKKFGDISLGGGVIINYHADSHKELSNLAEQIAINHNIPFQRTANRVSSGGTNAAMIQTAAEGVKTLLLSVPCRYMHTQVEMCDLRDIEATIELLVEIVVYFDQNMA